MLKLLLRRYRPQIKSHLMHYCEVLDAPLCAGLHAGIKLLHQSPITEGLLYCHAQRRELIFFPLSQSFDK